MADIEVVNINLTSGGKLASSLIEQLQEAFVELEANKVVSTSDVRWNDVEEHLHHLESTVRKKLKELETKEKLHAERESHNQKLIAEREAEILSKEQDMLDKVQELKDAAVAAIAEAKASYMPNDGNQVSSSIEIENAPLDAQEGKSPSQKEENSEAVEVNPRAELIQFCEQMDSKGLLNFLTENLKNLSVMENLNNVSDVCKEQLSVVLGSATEPTQLVLEALEGFYPPKETFQEGDDNNAANSGMLRSCIILMEALSAFLTKTESAADSYFNLEIKQHALAIASEWKPKSGENIDAANVNSLEAEGFLQLLATFRIASEFDQEELCKCLLAVAQHSQAIELCHSLGLTQKIPGLVETLISSGRQIDAVHFIHAFHLSESFPPVPILRAYLKELRRNSQGNGVASVQNDCNARELEALKTVISCVQQYNLEAEYPLDPLRKRLTQLEKSLKGDKKRTTEGGKKQEQKKPRFNGEFQGSRPRGRQGPPSMKYGGLQERYPPVSGVHNYPAAGPSPYAAQPTIQSSYNYAQDSRPQVPYSAAPPTYGVYVQPPRYPYM